MEGELETLQLATGKEEREKADILAAEKKARAQVQCMCARGKYSVFLDPYPLISG